MTMKKYLAWVDTETTGLNVSFAKILEIAITITDTDLNLIDYAEYAIHQDDTTLANMEQWCITQHGNSGVTQRSRESTFTEEFVENKLIKFMLKYIEPITSPMCGNSIWFDRVVLMKHMSYLVNIFHYRNIDVSTVKELIAIWYPEALTNFVKKNHHQALLDINESIDELKYYRSLIPIPLITKE